MKRIIMLVMVLVMMLASLGGCWPWWYEDGRGGRGEGHDRGGGYDRGCIDPGADPACRGNPGNYSIPDR